MNTRDDRNGGRIDYTERFARVADHVREHLDEDLRLEVLAEIACLSPTHWHRIYYAMYGETLAGMVRRLRLQRAASDLAYGDLPMVEIARRAGYDAVASFTRAFKAAVGQPPAEFRRTGGHVKFAITPIQKDCAMYDVEIVEVARMRVVGIEHRGAYHEIGAAFAKAYAIAAERGLLGAGMRMVGVYFDDPTLVSSQALRALAGFIVDADFPRAAPFVEIEIGGGVAARLRVKGPYAQLPAAYEWLYGQWLPQSGRAAAEAPAFEEYLNTPMTTPASELLTDICLPLR